MCVASVILVMRVAVFIMRHVIMIVTMLALFGVILMSIVIFASVTVVIMLGFMIVIIVIKGRARPELQLQRAIDIQQFGHPRPPRQGLKRAFQPGCQCFANPEHRISAVQRQRLGALAA